VFSIRQIQPDDAQQYFELRAASEREFPEFVGINGERELLAGDKSIRAVLANYPDEGTVAFGAFKGQSLAAIACVSCKKSPKYRHKGFLWGMYVRDRNRGQKLGDLLMQHIVQWARSQKLLALQLQVTTTNVAAERLYMKHGFSTYGTERKSLCANGTFYHVHLMELSLT